MQHSDAAKTALIKAALPDIPFDGWEAAISKQKLAEVYFPRGAIDAIGWHSHLADEAMRRAIRELPLTEMRVPQKVKAAIMARLHAQLPHREAVRRAMGILAFPLHAGESLKLLSHTVDAIWNAIGDASIDYNWYTKRLTLAGVYSATVLFWLNDESEGLADTEAFLDRRLRDVHQFGQLKKQCTEFAKSVIPASRSEAETGEANAGI